MFCVTRVCVSMYIYITSSLAVVVFCDDFLLLGKYTKKEGELVLSLCSLSKGAASLTQKLSKDEKERRKEKKRPKRGEKERLVLTGSRLLKKYNK